MYYGGLENRAFILIFSWSWNLCTFWSERVRLHESNISSTDKKVLSVEYIRGIPCLLLASEKETKEMNNTENYMHFCMPNFPLYIPFKVTHSCPLFPCSFWKGKWRVKKYRKHYTWSRFSWCVGRWGRLGTSWAQEQVDSDKNGEKWSFMPCYVRCMPWCSLL